MRPAVPAAEALLPCTLRCLVASLVEVVSLHMAGWGSLRAIPGGT
jgi:hypothetical protein